MSEKAGKASQYSFVPPSSALAGVGGVTLWAYKTTSRKPTGISLFILAYGMEAIIPIKIRTPAVQAEIPKKANVKAISKDLNTTDELWEAAAMHIASYQQRLANLHNR